MTIKIKISLVVSRESHCQVIAISIAARWEKWENSEPNKEPGFKQKPQFKLNNRVGRAYDSRKVWVIISKIKRQTLLPGWQTIEDKMPAWMFEQCRWITAGHSDTVLEFVLWEKSNM